MCSWLWCCCSQALVCMPSMLSITDRQQHQVVYGHRQQTRCHPSPRTQTEAGSYNSTFAETMQRLWMQVHSRVKLAVKIDEVQHSQSKQKAEMSWRRRNAEQVGA